MTFDPAHVAASLTTGQRNRLIALARAGQSLPWGRSDDALERLRLVRRYSGPLDGEFADLADYGFRVVRQIQK